MITCPKTGKPVSTGFDMDERSFAGSAVTGNTFGPCPACGETHTWAKEDAFLGAARSPGHRPPPE